MTHLTKILNLAETIGITCSGPYLFYSGFKSINLRNVISNLHTGNNQSLIDLHDKCVRF